MPDAPRSLVYIPIDELPSADRNPKDHDAVGTAASISRFGYIEPIVVDERTEKIVAGHGRRDELVRRRDAGESPPDGVVLDEEGRWTAPVVRGWASRDDADAYAAGIALNRIGEGRWKYDDLTAVLALLAETEAGLDGIGFDAGDLADLQSLYGAQARVTADELADVMRDITIATPPTLVVRTTAEIVARFRALPGESDHDRLVGLLDAYS